MKNRFLFMVTLALILAAVAPPAMAQEEEFVSFYRGETAQAAFSSTAGCVTTDVFVFATKSKTYTSPGPVEKGAEATLAIFQYDSCNATDIFLDVHGTALLSKQEFRVDSQLNWATLNKTINVCDFVTSSCFDVAVALDWTGTGPLSVQRNHTHFESAGCEITTRDVGLTRPVTAVGSVSDGVTNFTSEPPVFTELVKAKSGEVIEGVGCF